LLAENLKSWAKEETKDGKRKKENIKKRKKRER
jgi:hypothetical protein